LKENEFSYRELSRSPSKEKIKIILLGASKIRAIQIFLSQILLPNVKIQFIKSSYRNSSSDLLIKFLLKYIFSNIYVTDLDNNYFSSFESSRRIPLNIPMIINENIRDLNYGFELTKNKNREIDIAYVGRVDKDKGFFDALEVMKSPDFKKYNKLMQLLLWETNHEKRILSAIQTGTITENFKIESSSKYNSNPPSYNNIKLLILPYGSLETTIRIPLVIIEAILHGCIVLLPSWIREDADLMYVINTAKDYDDSGYAAFYKGPEMIQEEALKILCKMSK
jgi:glycosyltransferase involved in cell wall biosynthesis